MTQRFEHLVKVAAVQHLTLCVEEIEKLGYEVVTMTNGYDVTTRILIFKRPVNWPHSDELRK